MRRYLFIIILSVGVLYNIFSFYSGYDFSLKPVKNIAPFYQSAMAQFKQNYPGVKKVGFYTSEEKMKEAIFYDIQDSLSPVFVDDSTDNEKIICVSYFNICNDLAQRENMFISDILPENVFVLGRSDK